MGLAALSDEAPLAWTVDSRGMALGVVQFHAPIKEEWKEELHSRGLSPLRYLPHDAFVVRGPLDSFREVSALGYVEGTAPYATERQVRTELPPDDLVDVRILVFPDAYPGTIMAWLAHRGIPSATRDPTGPEVLGAFGSGAFQWVRARIPSSLVASLAQHPSVEFVDPVRPVRIWNRETNGVIQTNTTNNYRYWSFGLSGSGQVIGLADTGLDYDGAAFRQDASTIVLGDLYNATDGARRKVVRYVNMGIVTELITWPGGGGPWDPGSIQDCASGHGTGVASTLAGHDDPVGGSSPNDGNALLGQIYFQDIGGLLGGASCQDTGEGLIYLPEDYENLFGPPGLVYHDPIAPVRIHSNSWGGESNVYDVQARMVDAFVWAHPDMTILFAAGNCLSGCPRVGSLGTPSTAKNVITVGGAWNPDTGSGLDQNDLADQSGRGPTSDGRIKPTIVTIFNGHSVMSDGDPWSGSGLPDARWGGTSYATPAASAAAAIVRQYFTDGWYPAGRPVAANAMTPSAALVRAVLIASGQQMTGDGTVFRASADQWPNHEQGFGRLQLSRVLPIAASGDAFLTAVVDETTGLLTGDEVSHTFNVATAGPVKFVLAWNDYPGTLGAAKAIVNDLDLQVRAPDGTLYWGNRFGSFAQGQSVPGGTFDTTNVEEAVILRSAMPGEWSVRVIASNVPVGPQPFALVVTGNVDGSYGRAILDRPAYSETDTIRIRVEDTTVGSPSVHVASGLESAGETVPLSQGGPDEVWRASIPLAFGTAVPDGVLQVREGDPITVTYQDASPAHTSTARAKVFASGPSIHDVTVRAMSASGASVAWKTVEPSTSEVLYGTDPASLDLRVGSDDLVMDHAVPLTRLAPGTLYYFEVLSRSRVGNTTRDSNGGLAYRFETPPAGDVLVVIGGESFPPEREASYTAALNRNGWTWSFWRTADLGPPPLAFLQDRRAVVWQVGLERYPPFNQTERSLVKTYLDRGGRLLVSSHDTTWALADPLSPFETSDSADWVAATLKAHFVCDPLSIVRLVGVPGDPISGAYTAGVGYASHREGGAVDELAPTPAGGTSVSMWTDDAQVSGCTPSNRPVGLRWISSGPNGTLADGVWGVRPSRLAYLAFELTGLDATPTDLNPASLTRAAVLDAALRWLVSASPSSLDRDHPDVNITSPNAGTFADPVIPVTWTASASGSGVALSGITLASSSDGGATWSPIASLPGSARTYAWDIGSVPNADRYMLRVTTQDDGAPSLTGSDTTDSTFAIARPGGDMTGPAVWAGSLRVSPNPPGAARAVTLNATADDRLRGGSPVAAAELFLQATAPLPGDAGRGLPLAPVDGAFDGPVERVTWQAGFPVPPGGSVCAWVHAQDAAGNWGNYTSHCTIVIDAGPDDVAPAAASVDAVMLVGQDLSIGWPATWDDALFGGTSEYRVLRANAPSGPFAVVSGPIAANGSARYAFVDPGRGGDAPDYFYQIRTADPSGHTTLSMSLAAKVRVPFSAGLNLLGIPLRLTDPSLRNLFAGRGWEDAWTYNGCESASDGWSPAVSADVRDFAPVVGRGLWVNATAADDVTALGVIESANRIPLCAGWNLIALPGLAGGITVQGLMTATGASRVSGFDPAGPYHVRNLDPADTLVAGRGYWVYVPADVDWNVPGW